MNGEAWSISKYHTLNSRPKSELYEYNIILTVIQHGFETRSIECATDNKLIGNGSARTTRRTMQSVVFAKDGVPQ